MTMCPTENNGDSKRGFPGKVFDALHEDNPVVCVNGDTVDLVPLKKDGKYGNLITLLRKASLERDYSIVIEYDPATNSLTFVDELLDEDRGYRAKMEDADLFVQMDGNDDNLVPGMLNSNSIKSAYGSSPDRVVLAMMKQAITVHDLKVCLIINHANLFLCSGNDGQAASAPERPLNSAIVSDFIGFLQENDGSHIVFIDRTNAVETLRDQMSFLSVPATTTADIRALIAKVIDLNEYPEALALAAGTRIKDLRANIRKMADKAPEELLLLLKRFKEEQVVALAGGAVKCSFEEYRPDMLAMPDAERQWWEEMAAMLKMGADLLPQAVGLMGPPGTGKSIRPKNLAALMGVPYLEVDDTNADGLRGISAKKLRLALEAAIRIKPCVLFIDEIDKKLPVTEGKRNGNGADNDDAEVAALFQSMLGSKEMEGVLVIGAANNFDQVNEALLRHGGRFGVRVAVLPPTTLEDKVKVFRAVSAQVKGLDGVDIDDKIIKVIVQALEGASGADYRELVRASAQKWVLEKKAKVFDIVMLEQFATFRFRVNEKTEAMIAKAIDMHTAPFKIEGYSGDVEDGEQVGDSELSTLANLLTELKNERGELAAAIETQAAAHADLAKQRTALESEHSTAMARVDEGVEERVTRELAEKNAHLEKALADTIKERKKLVFIQIGLERQKETLEAEHSRAMANVNKGVDRRVNNEVKEERARIKQLESDLAIEIAGLESRKLAIIQSKAILDDHVEAVKKGLDEIASLRAARALADILTPLKDTETLPDRGQYIEIIDVNRGRLEIISTTHNDREFKEKGRFQTGDIVELDGELFCLQGRSLGWYGQSKGFLFTSMQNGNRHYYYDESSEIQRMNLLKRGGTYKLNSGDLNQQLISDKTQYIRISNEDPRKTILEVNVNSQTVQINGRTVEICRRTQHRDIGFGSIVSQRKIFRGELTTGFCEGIVRWSTDDSGDLIMYIIRLNTAERITANTPMVAVPVNETEEHNGSPSRIPSVNICRSRYIHPIRHHLSFDPLNFERFNNGNTQATLATSKQPTSDLESPAPHGRSAHQRTNAYSR
jgi:SpoVK/Ycf46/Vps4 family AAA+-type ATPase